MANSTESVRQGWQVKSSPKKNTWAFVILSFIHHQKPLAKANLEKNADFASKKA